MRKFQKQDLQIQANPRVPLVLDFYLRMGICIYTNEQFDRKCECAK
jgi:hypothetical protein